MHTTASEHSSAKRKITIASTSARFIQTHYSFVRCVGLHTHTRARARVPDYFSLFNCDRDHVDDDDGDDDVVVVVVVGIAGGGFGFE